MIDGEKFDCFIIILVFCCFEDCQVIELWIMGFQLICRKIDSKEVFKIFDEIVKCIVDFIGSDVYLKENFVEYFVCDCSVCSQWNI